MGEHQELASFRRFQSLGMKSLLYMQAELLHLENELKAIENEDQTSHDPERAYLHASVFNLKQSAGTSHEIQWRKVLEIREKVRLYSKALVLQAQVNALPAPGTRDLTTLQEWLDRPEGGDFFLQGREADTWECKDDLVTLSSFQANKDLLTAFIEECVVPRYHSLARRWTKVSISGP
ncbi:MAG: hypothetical protein Q9220_000377 [cf. Caloplaca sp. 1 TL-2023]